MAQAGTFVYVDRMMNDAHNPFDEPRRSEHGNPDVAIRLDEQPVREIGTRFQPEPPSRHLRPRRKRLPAILFAITCFSTFFAGATGWLPAAYLISLDGDGMRQAIVRNWREGLIYMGCVLAILLTHEMGHFLATLRCRSSCRFPSRRSGPWER